MSETNNDEVICPACCHQFPAIPVNVQKRIAELEAELKEAKSHIGYRAFDRIRQVATDLLGKVRELEAQVEAMKCCGNCKDESKCWDLSGRDPVLIRFACNAFENEQRIWENWKVRQG